MSKPAVADCDEMPSHPNAPKTVAKRASARGGSNSFVHGGGKGKGKKGRRKHAKK
jgi:hypothetical protein